MSIWHLLWVPSILVIGFGLAACLSVGKLADERNAWGRERAKMEVETIKWKNVAQAWLDEYQRLTNELKGKGGPT